MVVNTCIDRLSASRSGRQPDYGVMTGGRFRTDESGRFCLWGYDQSMAKRRKSIDRVTMNTDSEGPFRVAIIGGGPRGLAALEFLYRALAAQNSPPIVHCVLFDASGFPGSGPNYAPDQYAGSWLNLPEREVSLSSRPELVFAEGSVKSFDSYREWSKGEGSSCESSSVRSSEDASVDRFPPRALLGEYLGARFDSIASSLEEMGWLSFIPSEVQRVQLSRSQRGYRIVHADGVIEAVDEVVLTIGHQTTSQDKTMRLWEEFADSHDNCTLISSPYPLEHFMSDERLGHGCTVALRGLGLSMIDVVKSLSEGRGGQFTIIDEPRRGMRYIPSGREPEKIIPFSLDGLPMAAKPLNKEQDDRYAPDAQQKAFFVQECDACSFMGRGREGYRRLLLAISRVQAGVYARLDSAQNNKLTVVQLTDISLEWLQDEDYRHALIVDRTLPTAQAMRLFADMACDLEPASFDYCFGQVWRHLQKTLFRSLSHSNLSLESMNGIVQLHERMKRYAYGPPVDNVQRLLALLDAGLLCLLVVDDPDIETSQEGWRFMAQGHQLTASVLIDTVLASPVISDVDTPLVRQLLADGYLNPLDDNLGAATTVGSLAVACNRPGTLPAIAVLGRLAKGSILGADSISESFGREQEEWAEHLVRRLMRPVSGRVLP